MGFESRIRAITTNPRARTLLFSGATLAFAFGGPAIGLSATFAGIMASLYGNLAATDALNDVPDVDLKRVLSNWHIARTMGKTVELVVSQVARDLGKKGWTQADDIPGKYTAIDRDGPMPPELRSMQIAVVFRLEPGETVQDMLAGSPLDEDQWYAILARLDAAAKKPVGGDVLRAAAKELAGGFVRAFFTVVCSDLPDASEAHKKIQLLLGALDRRQGAEADAEILRQIDHVREELTAFERRDRDQREWLTEQFANLHPRPPGYVPGDTHQTAPDDSLHFAARKIPYLGRADDRRRFMEFWNREERFLWELITGPAGDGKSRFALACVHLIQDRAALGRHDEEAFFVRLDQVEAGGTIWRGWQVARPTLIVVDYAYRDLEKVAAMLQALHERQAEFAKVRVILLERAFVKPAIEARLQGMPALAANFGRVGRSASDNPLRQIGIRSEIGWTLKPLEEADLRGVMRETAQLAELEWNAALADEDIRWLRAHGLLRPLWAVLAGVGLHRRRTDGDDPRASLIEYVADGEWRKAVDLCGGDRDEAAGYLAPLLAATVVTDSTRSDQGARLSREEFLRAGVLNRGLERADHVGAGGCEKGRALFGRLAETSVAGFGPILPDIVGEHLVLAVLEEAWPMQGAGVDADIAPKLRESLVRWIAPQGGARRQAGPFLLRAHDSFPERAKARTEFGLAEDAFLEALTVADQDSIDDGQYAAVLAQALRHPDIRPLLGWVLGKFCTSTERLEQLVAHGNDLPASLVALGAFGLAAASGHVPDLDVGLKVLRDLVAAHPADAQIRENYAMVLTNRANRAVETDLESGALKVLRDLYEAHIDDAQVRESYVGALYNCTNNAAETDLESGALKVLRDLVAAHSEDAQVREWFAKALYNRATRADETDLESGALKVLRDLYEAHTDDAQVRESYVGALYNCTNNAAETDLESGALKVLRDLVAAHSEDAQVREWFAKALYNRTNRAAETDLESGALKVLRDLHEAHPDDAPVREQYAMALFNRALRAEETDLESGALKVLRDLYAAHPEDAQVRQWFAKALVNRANRAEETDLESGALKVLRDLHRAHPEDAQVRESYAMALYNRALRAAETDLESGALRVLGDLYAAHPDDAQVREQYAKALVNRAARALETDLESGALKVLRDLYEAHPEDSQVREWFASALVNRAARAEEPDLESGALTVLRDLYEAQSDDAQVRENYGMALYNRTIDAGETDLESGALKVIRDLYEAHIDDAQVREQYAMALANRTNRAAETDLESGALKVLRDLVAGHPEDAQVRKGYAMALYNRTLRAEETDLESGALKVLRDLHAAYPEDAQVRENYATALYNRTNRAAETDPESGALKVLRDLVAAHPDDAPVREQYAKALFSRTNRAAETDLESGAPKVLRDLHRAHPEDARVREQYATALYNRALRAAEIDFESGALRVLGDLYAAHRDDAQVREWYASALVAVQVMAWRRGEGEPFALDAIQSLANDSAAQEPEAWLTSALEGFLAIARANPVDAGARYATLPVYQERPEHIISKLVQFLLTARA